MGVPAIFGGVKSAGKWGRARGSPARTRRRSWQKRLPKRFPRAPVHSVISPCPRGNKSISNGLATVGAACALGGPVFQQSILASCEIFSFPKGQPRVQPARCRAISGYAKGFSLSESKDWGFQSFRSTVSQLAHLEIAPHPENGSNDSHRQDKTLEVQGSTWCPTLSEC